jgi:hypothetical protein
LSKSGWIRGTSFDFRLGQGGKIHAIKIMEAVVAASKENVQEVNAERTKYMVISRGHHAGQKPQYKDK